MSTLEDSRFFRRNCLPTMALAALFISGSTTQLSAQSVSKDKMAFEVVSVKPDRSGPGRTSFQFIPGRFTATNCTVKDLIQFAYLAQDYQIANAPGWISTEHYDIDATVPDSIAEKLRQSTQLQQVDPSNPIKMTLLQSLLADRFKLAITRATKPMTVYVLVVAKGGPKLTPTATPPTDLSNPNPQVQGRNGPSMGITGRGQIVGTGVPVRALALILSRQFGQQVLDQTGLQGTYDIKLQWTPDETQPLRSPGSPAPDASNAPPPDASDASIFSALKEQLGLELKTQKEPVDTLVVEHVEQPLPN
jgi:uncharacterized protein (TIGR03435 family)